MHATPTPAIHLIRPDIGAAMKLYGALMGTCHEDLPSGKGKNTFSRSIGLEVYQVMDPAADGVDLSPQDHRFAPGECVAVLSLVTQFPKEDDDMRTIAAVDGHKLLKQVQEQFTEMISLCGPPPNHRNGKTRSAYVMQSEKIARQVMKMAFADVDTTQRLDGPQLDYSTQQIDPDQPDIE